MRACPAAFLLALAATQAALPAAAQATLPALQVAPSTAEPSKPAATAKAAEPPLRAGVVPSAPPFVLRDAKGRLTGFSVQLFQAIAARLKRQVIYTEAPFPELQVALAAGKLDVLPGPIPATPERAADMLLTEGYVWSEDQFGTRPDTSLTALGDLRGKRLSVQAGSEYADWAARNAGKYGFIAVAEPTLSDVFNAVRTHEADASLTDSAALRGAAAHGPRNAGKLAAALSLPETRTHMSLAVDDEATDLRDEIEDALQCLKQEGVVAKLSATWLGEVPGPEDLENIIIPGYGVPGLAGYDPKPRKNNCNA